MSLESSNDHGTTGVRSKLARFGEWRRRRPFAGGVLLLLAGLLIGWVPTQFAFELMLVGGSYTFIGLAWAIGVFLTGVFVLYRPELSTILGVVGVVLSILSLLGALGGLLIGMLLGVVGGNLCVAWSGPSPDRDGREDGDDSDDPPREDRRDDRTDGGFQFGEARSGESAASGEPNESGAGKWGFRLVGAAAVVELLSRVRSDADRADIASRTGTALRTALGRLRERAAATAGELRRGTHRFDPGGLDRSDVPAFDRSDLRDVSRSDLRERAADASRWVVDAASSDDPSKRLAVVFALLVVTGGTLTLVGTLPAAAILGDSERTSYTVDVGEIRLGDDGRICAVSIGNDAYRVMITNATLVDTAIYQERNGEVVRSTFPTLEVDDALVMDTSGAGERLGLLASTVGCTREDQTTRTVFRNRYQASSLLRGADGVSMLISENPDAVVPEAGGFQFVEPRTGNETAADEVTNTTEDVVGGVTDVIDGGASGAPGDGSALPDSPLGNETTGPVEEVPNGTVGDETGGAGNETGTRDGLPDGLENVTGGDGDAPERIENVTEDVVEGDPPENLTEVVDRVVDGFENATRVIENATRAFRNSSEVAADPSDRLANATEVATDDATATPADVNDGERDSNDTAAIGGNSDDAGNDTTDATPPGSSATATPASPGTPAPTETPESSDGLVGAVDRIVNPETETESKSASDPETETATQTDADATATERRSTATEAGESSAAATATATRTPATSTQAATDSAESTSTPADDSPAPTPAPQTPTPGDDGFDWDSDFTLLPAGDEGGDENPEPSDGDATGGTESDGTEETGETTASGEPTGGEGSDDVDESDGTDEREDSDESDGSDETTPTSGDESVTGTATATPDGDAQTATAG